MLAATSAFLVGNQAVRAEAGDEPVTTSAPPRRRLSKEKQENMPKVQEEQHRGRKKQKDRASNEHRNGGQFANRGVHGVRDGRKARIGAGRRGGDRAGPPAGNRYASMPGMRSGALVRTKKPGAPLRRQASSTGISVRSDRSGNRAEACDIDFV